MFNILNRFAWILSFFLSFFIFYIITPYSERGYIIIPLIILWFIIKWIFLSAKFIKGNITDFSKKLIKVIWEDESHENKQETTLQREIPVTQEDIDKKPIYNEIILEDINYTIPNLNISTNDEDKTLEIGLEKDVQTPLESQTEIAQLEEEPKQPWIFKKFFSENLFAKIWGILIFLWMMFFLLGIYTLIWPFWKIIIWILFGLGIYAVWLFLDKKWYEQESRVLLGIWILINYLVILWWRYLLRGSDTIAPYLNEWITLLFLIANTLFAIITSLKFSSKTLLIFSFVFAYLNPFLIWWEASTPYTLISYSIVLSLWIFALAYFKSNLWEKSIYENLLYIWLIWWNLTILIAPFTTSGQWIFKLIFLAIISIAALILTVYKKDTKNISWVFLSAYIFFTFLLFYGDINIQWFYNWFDIYISYTIFLFLFMLLWVYFVIFSAVSIVWRLLFWPIILLIWLTLLWDITYLVPSFTIFMVIFLIIFSLIYKKLDSKKLNIFFIILFIYALICWLNISAFTQINLNIYNFYAVIVTLFLFMIYAYYFSKKDWLENLYSLGTIGTGIIFLTIFRTTGELMRPSIIWISLYFVLNIIEPFLNTKLWEGNRKSLILWIIAWFIFATINIWNFGMHYCNSLQIGFIFLGLTIFYLIIWSYILNKLISSNSDIDNNDRNLIYAYFGVAIVSFCIAIWFAFNKNEIFIPIIWLLVSNLIMFFFTKFQDKKIYIAWYIMIIAALLYFIWISNWNITNLPYLSVIWILLVVNLYFISKIEFEEKTSFDILYMIWHFLIILNLINIFKTYTYDYWTSAISIYFFLLSIVNYYLPSKNIKFVHTICLGYITFMHIINFETALDKINYMTDNRILNYINKFMEYIIIILNMWSIYLTRKTDLDYKKILYYIWFLYFFISTTLIIHINSSNTFFITIYWGILALIMFFYGIKKDILKYRTLWLYIIMLTLSKVFFYDLWYGLNEVRSRVVAFMILWVIMIYISMLYTKKINKPLKQELDFENLCQDDNQL